LPERVSRIVDEYNKMLDFSRDALLNNWKISDWPKLQMYI
jgi:hypothetical protein